MSKEKESVYNKQAEAEHQEDLENMDREELKLTHIVILHECTHVHTPPSHSAIAVNITRARGGKTEHEGRQVGGRRSNR